MADIESVLKELICEVLEHEVDVPDENDIEKMVEQYLSDNLRSHVENEINSNSNVGTIISSMVLDELESQREVSQKLFDDGLLKLRREIESHTINYKVKAMRKWIGSKFRWMAFRKRRNRQKVMLLSLFI